MYQSLEATLHDLFWQAEPDADELPLIRSFLRRYCGETLEVGCGSGRLLLALLDEGFAVEGVELSKEMLNLLKQKASSQGKQPTIHHADICDFSTDKRYQAITIPAFTLQLLSRPAAQLALENLRKLASTNAGLYLTCFIPWAEITGELEEDNWYLDKEANTADGEIARCETRHRINRLEQCLQRQHRYTLRQADDKPVNSHHSEQLLQWFHLAELNLMLENAGWKVTRLITDFTPGQADADAQIITLEATTH